MGMQSKKNKILVVEDDLSLETILTPIFSKMAPRTELTWVTNAEEARQLLEHESYILIFADCYLSGALTGLDLWDLCREKYPGTPFILTSGMEIGTFFKLISENQISPAYLQKPFYAGECLQYLRSLLPAPEAHP